MTRERDIAVDKKIEELRNHFLDIKEEFIRKHPEWNQVHDVRITTFFKCVEVLDCIQQGRIHIAGSMTNFSWWENNMKNFDPVGSEFVPIQRSQIQAYVDKYDKHVRLSLVHFLFSAIESSLRALAKTNEFGMRGTESFWKIRDKILELRNLETHKELFNLYACMRNTIHNNSIYYPSSGGGDQSFNFKGAAIEFKVGKAINFGTWEFLIDFCFEIASALRDIFSHEDLAREALIQDPASLI